MQLVDFFDQVFFLELFEVNVMLFVETLLHALEFLALIAVLDSLLFEFFV